MENGRHAENSITTQTENLFKKNENVFLDITKMYK